MRALILAMDLDVSVIVGHSAGAAIGARITLDSMGDPARSDAARSGTERRDAEGRGAERRDITSPGAIVAINGAFLPLAGLPGLLFPPVARLMAATPLAPQLFARRSWDRAAVEKLIGGTGSKLDAQGLALYGALVSDARHAAGALGMMAHWDLRPLQRDLARLSTPLAMIVGENDRAVPPRDSRRVREAIPESMPVTLDEVRGAGHLVHEEVPDEVARLMMAALRTMNLQGSTLPITS